ncbi:MAG: GNAT family N-acetyltransferase [Cytophagales bacterium]|nr:MAG: GNAT family N-acetyltransferase [Cytophagales bacterium]
MNLTIRPATPDDLPTAYAFLCDLEDETLDQAKFEAVYSRNLANPAVFYRVAELGGEVVGFLSCHVQHLLHHTGPVGEIQELYVRPDCRNQRIGHAFMKFLDELVGEEGLVNLEVTTNQKRTDTARFYEQTGFARTHWKLVKQVIH